MLNDIIKFDLHIHSKESAYKEANGYVDESNIDNVEILMNKLEENAISVFSITDHNRFDFEMYAKFKSILEGENNYNYVKKILPGIEFDVKFEEDMEVCHIICIFDDSDLEKIRLIKEKIQEVRYLTSEADFYKIEEVDKILKEIGLDTILIAHQKKGLNANGLNGHESISDSVKDIKSFLKIGYIDAFEYNKPRIEGIVKNSLYDINEKIPTITGSDCHQWSEYPKKDNRAQVKEYISSVKCLPTFKGILLSLTSPDSRFCRNISGTNYIEKLNINGKEVLLSPSLNAIVGDNGAGKSFLLNFINNTLSQNVYKDIIKNNIVDCVKSEALRIEHIKQNEIVDNVKNGQLFNGDGEFYYKISNTETFGNNIRSYAKKLISYIESNINLKSKEDELEKINIDIKEVSKEFYYINLQNDIESNDLENENEDRYTQVNSIMSMVQKEFVDNKEYYDNFKLETKAIMDSITDLKEKINFKKVKTNNEIQIKSIIMKNFSHYNTLINIKRTASEKENIKHLKENQSFISKIVNVINLKNKIKAYPEFPEKLDGLSSKKYIGYEFVKKAKYNQQNLKDDFYKELFNKSIKEEEIITIKTKKDMIDVLKGVTKYEDIKADWETSKIENFIKKYTAEETYITETDISTSIGNTPGEVSLVFYKFKLTDDDKFDILLIDQPEDNINAKKIQDFLITYLNMIRDKKQVIFVTHNPLLVVNLDVDNVVYLEKNKDNKLKAISGCLEYENEGKPLINLVGDILDGGREAIERRMKIYGKC